MPAWHEVFERKAKRRRPSAPAATHEHTVPRIWPMEDPEEEKTPLRVTLLLVIGPFVFLALLALVLILAGARPN